MSHYKNLLAQAEKLYRHNRQGSYQTRMRYQEVFSKFLKFVAEEYRLEKIQNIAPKHFEAYFAHLKAKGLAASTIKTEASAIRFWHDKISNAKHRLPTNDDLKLERRKFGGVDRTWSNSELELMIAECRKANRPDWESCLIIAHNAGLRIHETMRIDTAIARAALKTGVIIIKGKNGRIRAVPIDNAVRTELENSLRHAPEGHKLFVEEDRQTHLAIKNLQRFIRTRWEKVQSPDSDDNFPITFHGLRHNYARGRYTELEPSGYVEEVPLKDVSALMGHNRPDVTRIYLPKLRKKPKPPQSGENDGHA